MTISSKCHQLTHMFLSCSFPPPGLPGQAGSSIPKSSCTQLPLCSHVHSLVFLSLTGLCPHLIQVTVAAAPFPLQVSHLHSVLLLQWSPVCSFLRILSFPLLNAPFPCSLGGSSSSRMCAMGKSSMAFISPGLWSQAEPEKTQVRVL